MPTVAQLPLPGEVFEINGHSAFLIQPEEPSVAPNRDWIFYAPIIGKHPDVTEKWMFERFIAKGMSIAGVDVGESHGNPDGRRVFRALYDELVHRRGFARRAALLARSRGGLMLYNFAAEHPDCVSRIAGIYPVCDLRSYPGLDKACGAFSMTEQELLEHLPEHNPISRLEPLAQAGIRIFHIHGDKDELVPLDANSLELKHRYDALGGDMILRVVKGGGHTLWRGWFECEELVDFLTEVDSSKESAR